MRRPFFLGALLPLLVCSAPLDAAPPAWWSAGTPPVIDPNAPVDNHAAASIGQAKWMAKKALEALRALDPSTADLVEAELVGPGKPIPNWDPPADDAERQLQKAPLMVGQLKAISAPFYDYLNAVNASWLLSQRTLNLTEVDMGYYPWTLARTDDENKGIAKIGQLKAVFSLRFETYDIEEVASYEQWAERHFGVDHTESPQGDADGDGFTNAQEFARASSPTNQYQIPDPQEAGTYAPDLRWIGASRSLFYDYMESDPPEGEEPQVLDTSRLVMSGSFKGAASEDTQIQERIPLASLHGRLSDKVKYPLGATWDGGSSYPAHPNVFALNHSCFVQDHWERVATAHKLVRLYGVKAPAVDTTKNLIVAKYVGNPYVFSSYEIHSETLRRNTLFSNGKVFGPEISPGDGLRTSQLFFTPDFFPLFNEPSDETKGMLWVGGAVGTVIPTFVDTNGLPPAIWNNLEVVGAGEGISVEAFSDGGVYITGTSPTGPNGASVILRDKMNHGKIVAEMRVHIFTPRTVPVSIYRLHDSRVPASQFSGGLTNAEMLDEMNATFGHQGGVQFTLAADSRTVDLAFHPVTNAPLPGEPLFDEYGTFTITEAAIPARNLTKLLHGQENQRISIHVLKYPWHPNTTLGVAYPDLRACFINHSTEPYVVAHEVGHTLHLATANADKGGHDLGPWPEVWANQGGVVGLMGPGSDLWRTRWIRREDWQKVTEQGQLLK